MGDDKNYRHRFTVPFDDVTVNTWIENQSNLGFSLRVLIKNFVRMYGNKDATCVELGTAVKRRGRPPKQAKAFMTQIDMSDNSDEYDDDYENQDDYDDETVENVDVEPVVQRKTLLPKKPQQTTSINKNHETDELVDMFRGNTIVSNSNANVHRSENGEVDFDKLING